MGWTLFDLVTEGTIGRRPAKAAGWFFVAIFVGAHLFHLGPAEWLWNSYVAVAITKATELLEVVIDHAVPQGAAR